MKKSILLGLAVIFSSYWLYLFVQDISPDDTVTKIFSSSYITLALLGGLFGLQRAFFWGGFKSLLGKALGFFSIGLLLTTMGSLTLTYYNVYLEQSPSYPSIAEVFYLSGILLYILGSVYLTKTLRSWDYIRQASLLKKVVLYLVPILMVAITVGSYVSSYDSTDVPVLALFTDYAYSISQAVYAAFALCALLSSGRLYGGYLRKAVTVLLIGLILQYVADTNYSYQQLSETWMNGGYGELLYLFAYGLIAYSILLFDKPPLVKKVETNE